jgi:tight adherence protein C
MTMLLAAAAGVLAAAGLVELLAAMVAARVATATRRGHGLARWAVALGRRVGAPAAPADLAARVAAAGLGPAVGPGDAMAAKAGGALLAALAAAPLALALTPRLTVALLAASGAGGFMAPDLWLARRARRRSARAALELPDVLDLLGVAVQAGLDPGRAVAEVGARRRGLLAAELRAVTARVQLGVPRAAALAELRRRLPLASIAALIAAIDRADRHGAPLAPALAALAEEARTERARALTEHAAAAAPRIQLVVALLLVPAVLLLVAAGLLRAMA